MVPHATGKEGVEVRRDGRVDLIPLAVALQALALFVLAFVLPAPPATDRGASGLGAGLDRSPVRTTSEARIPADLLPERIELPHFPDPQREPEKQQATSLGETRKSAEGTGLALAALRVESVAFDAPVAVRAVLALPGPPDRILPGSISQARFGEEGDRGYGRRGREGGWGGGLGPVGIVGRTGGTCGRAPAPAPPHIVERTRSLPLY
jgi:hypothetical protein